MFRHVKEKVSPAVTSIVVADFSLILYNASCQDKLNTQILTLMGVLFIEHLLSCLLFSQEHVVTRSRKGEG